MTTDAGTILRRRYRKAKGKSPRRPQVPTVALLERELSRMAGRQVLKIIRHLDSRASIERKLAELVRKRHARRRARLQQKSSRRRNRR